MNKWILVCLLASGGALACQPEPIGQVVADGLAEVSATDSLETKYNKIRDHIIAKFGADGFKDQSVQIVVNVETTFLFKSNIRPMTFDKHCTETIAQMVEKVRDSVSNGSGGGGTGGNDDPGGSNGDPNDPLAGCFIWPGGTATTDNGDGGGVTQEFFPSELICP